MADPQAVANDVVVSIAYKLTVDGEVLDEAVEKDALQYLHGYQNIISGLERELAGLKVGDSKQVTVAAKDGYGEVDKSAVQEVGIEEFEGIKPEVGMELEIKDKEGNELYGRVMAIKEESVIMDLNHPLAGKELHFDVKVVGLRAATGEERTHGHVHAHGHHH